VLALVGNTSLIDCAVNHAYYERKGFYAIVAGVPAECFTTSHLAPVNMGPRLSMMGIADYAARKGAKSLVVVASNNPGVEYYNNGVVSFGKAKGLKTTALTEDVPIQDANSVALKLANAAGKDGAVLLDFTAPEALKILQAVSQQGLINSVKMWSCGGSCNDASLVKALGPEWNGKFPINAELSSNASGADNRLYQQITKKYAPSIQFSSFGQLGYMAARYGTEALLSLKGKPITAKTVNAAIRNLKNVPSSIVCKPWYYGPLKFHQPVNTGRTINVNDGKFTEVEGCRDIPATDAALKVTRAAEKKLKLNTGG
jgi:branched-chain amino acid transport system substrate-binding protein